MRTRFVETTQNKDGAGAANWGKFMVGVFDEEELARGSNLPGASSVPLLRARGWNMTDVIVFDLETCEGAAFSPGGMVRADLEKHRVWVCPMFEPFLEWLYRWIAIPVEPVPYAIWRVGAWFDALPGLVELPDADFSMAGYRRGEAARPR